MTAQSDIDMAPLWRWQELASALDCPPVADGPDITGVSIDSRSARAGDLFIALAGDPGPRFFTSSPGNRDGHEFIVSAAGAGAAGALVSTRQPLALPQLRVQDTLDGLWALGRAAAARQSGVRIAITGSSGKTTAKSFLAAALSAVAESGSLNNFWGVPLCLARTPRDAKHAVYEVGTNQQGEIGPLSELVRPQVAVLLNVHPAHLGNFPSLDALRAEKLSIANGLSDVSQLVCEYSVARTAGLHNRVLTFGEERSAAVRLTDQMGDRATLTTPDGSFSLRIPGGGRHRGLTLAAVAATLLQVGEDPRRCAELPSALVPRGRGNERVVQRSAGDWVIVDDSYNANPASMAAALGALTEASGPRFAILGEMLELGDQSLSYHKDMAAHCAGLAGVYCVGEGMRPLYDALPQSVQLGYADTAPEIDLGTLTDSLPATGRLLVKGSNRVFWPHNFCDSVLAALAD